jgi:hypothetical protein
MKKANLLSVISLLLLICNFALANEPAIEKKNMRSTDMPSTVHCWCRINLGGPDWEGRDWDLSSVASYTGVAPQIKVKNQDDCREQCSSAILNWFNQNKDEVCKRFGSAGNATIVGQSELANNGPEVVSTLSTKCCEKPEVYVCPEGFRPDGGGKCKKDLGFCDKISPTPPDGTIIGDPNNPWGFWWGGGVTQWLKALVYEPKSYFSCCG